MKTNKSSNNKEKNRSEDVNENTNEKNKMNEMNQNTGTDKMYGSSQSNTPHYKSNKGTGMSSEAGSTQTEESWQGIGGSQSGTPKRNEGNKTHTSQPSEKLNTENIKNQSDQQRRSSMGDGTPEMDEKKLKDQKLTDNELKDVDWDVDDPENK